MAFKNKNSIVIVPADTLTPEIVDVLFGSIGEICLYKFETQSSGPSLCWLSFTNCIASEKAIKERNGMDILGKKIKVVKAFDYFRNPVSFHSKEDYSPNSSSTEDADVSYSENEIELPKIVKDIKHGKLSKSKDHSKKAKSNHHHSRNNFSNSFFSEFIEDKMKVKKDFDAKENKDKYGKNERNSSYSSDSEESERIKNHKDFSSHDENQTNKKENYYNCRDRGTRHEKRNSYDSYCDSSSEEEKNKRKKHERRHHKHHHHHLH